MTSPVRGNFGHIREPGVLLLTDADSTAKHKRNGILTGKSFVTLLTLGLGCKGLVKQSCKENEIRAININHYPELPYAMCVLLRDHKIVKYQGKIYENPYNEQDEETNLEQLELLNGFNGCCGGNR